MLVTLLFQQLYVPSDTPSGNRGTRGLNGDTYNYDMYVYDISRHKQ